MVALTFSMLVTTFTLILGVSCKKENSDHDNSGLIQNSTRQVLDSSSSGLGLTSEYAVLNDLTGVHLQIGDDISTRVGPFETEVAAKKYIEELYSEDSTKSRASFLPQKLDDIQVYGHRGMGGTTLMTGSNSNQFGQLPTGYVQENTIKSFETALLQQGADGVEFDIIVTKDGYPVVIHGDEVDKYVVGADPSGNKYGKISEMTLAEVKQINIAGSGKPKVTIPTLDEFYQMIEEVDVQRNSDGLMPAKTKVELKFPAGLPKKDKLVQVDRVMENLMGQVSSKKTTWADVTVQSFDRDALLHIRKSYIDKGLVPDDLRILVSLRTTDFYTAKHLNGFVPKPGAPFDPAKLVNLDKFLTELKPRVIEPAFGDINQPVIDLVKKHNAVLDLSFANYRYVPYEMIVAARRIALQVPIAIQGDNPAMLRKAFMEADPNGVSQRHFSRVEKPAAHHTNLKRFMNRFPDSKQRILTELQAGTSPLEIEKQIFLFQKGENTGRIFVDSSGSISVVPENISVVPDNASASSTSSRTLERVKQTSDSSTSKKGIYGAIGLAIGVVSGALIIDNKEKIGDALD